MYRWVVWMLAWPKQPPKGMDFPPFFNTNAA